MKKLEYIIFAIILLCGCSREEVDYDKFTSHEVKLSPRVNSEESTTRGSLISSSEELQSRSFMLYATAYNNDSGADYPVAKGEIAYSAANGWTPTEGHKIYWPTSESDVTFYAWHPATVVPNYHIYKQIEIESSSTAAQTPFGGTITLYKEGADVVHHDATGSVALQEDIIYSITTQKNPTQQSVEGIDPDYTVDLEFRHILTALRFAYKTQEGVEVRIKAMTLHNIKSVGRFNHGYNGDGSESLSWVTYDADQNAYIDPLPNYHSIPMEWGNRNFVSNSHEAVVVNSENDLMVFPQSVTAWLPDDGTHTYSIADNDAESGAKLAYLQIYCDIENVHGAGEIGDGKVYSSSDKSMTIDPDYCIYVPISSRDSDGKELWKAGNIVTYTLTFGSGYDKDGNKNDDITDPDTPLSVEVTATLNPWKEGGSYDVEF